MKKKLEAELISIAHRILKLKNRAELDQLQQETLKLYEKLSVLRFVEDNFSDVKPTIGYASAEEKLEEIYGLEEQPVEQKPAEQETAKTDDVKEQKSAAGEAKPDESGKETDDKEQEKNDDSEDVGEGEAVSEEEIEYTQEETDEEVQAEDTSDEKEEKPEETPVAEQKEEAKEEEKAAEKEKPKFDFEQDTEEPKKQKEITFEDFHDYKEPEFVKKSDIVELTSISKEFLPKEPEIIAKQEEQAETMWEETKPADTQEEESQAEPVRDWRDWEPSTSPYGSKPKEELKEEPKRSLNDMAGKTITLGLNDRIAFEKNLFGGSSEDLNRVLSQLNTLNSFEEARNFINDLVKPDYNDWKNKEEYEERFMAIVEKRFE